MPLAGRPARWARDAGGLLFDRASVRAGAVPGRVRLPISAKGRDPRHTGALSKREIGADAPKWRVHIRQKGLAAASQALPFIGGANRDRTGDLYNAIVALSQLSYGPVPPLPNPVPPAGQGRVRAKPL